MVLKRMILNKSRLTFHILGLLIFLFLNAYNSTAGASSLGTYSVDSIFLDFYREFRDESVLGPAISLTLLRKGLPINILSQTFWYMTGTGGL